MEEDGEQLYTLDHFCDGDILLETKRDIGGEMWCSLEGDFVGNDGCYEGCGNYNPCNGKNGRCRNLKHRYIETGKKYILNDGKITLLE